MKLVFFAGLCFLLATGILARAATMDLAGQWRLRLDPADQGVVARWHAAPLEGNDHIPLPGTTDLAGFGFALDTRTMLHAVPFPMTTRFPGVKEPARADEHGYLVRRHLHVGPAWYEREIEIPREWKDRPVVLRLERAMWRTTVWVDGRQAGSEDSLVAEHRHELGVLAPGRHRLTVRVDNRMIHNISTVTHAYGPETQSRWNGIIGAITLEAENALSIRSVATFPAPDRRSVRVIMHVANATATPVACSVMARLLEEQGDVSLAQVDNGMSCPPGRSTHELVLQLDRQARAWDEFNPVRYRILATLQNGRDTLDQAIAVLGFRHIERAGKTMRLNGRTVFLRGTLDCAVYPKTGHPPMTVPKWERVLRVVKEHGFNHVRFHTWCPPEAAFEAADRLGVYLQAEAPAWVDDWGTGTITRPAGIGRDPQVLAFLQAELLRMSESYGNHPSFVLCAIGNEFGINSTDWERVNALVDQIKTGDPRRLYAGCGARTHLAADDYWFTHNSGVSTRGIGPANTTWDFVKAAEASPVPVIAHETGQRPVFPDYEALLPKFTGPLLPLNLERYRRALVASGMDGQLKDFVRASARFQLVQYKAEHEAMLRTRGYAGYQLLMLNDFTGQSEALVGILDPFWETKGIVSAQDVRSWNAPTVVLARFQKYVWTSDETFRASLEVSHFGPADIPPGKVSWSFSRREGEPLGAGQLDTGVIPSGGVLPLGQVSVPLSAAKDASGVRLTVRLADAENHWNLWVYPAGGDEPEPAGFRVTTTLDEAALQTLKDGGKVLLLAHGMSSLRAARTGFESVYWSAGWWGSKFSALGVLCDPRHPALREFPTDGWSDWQWRDLCAGATTLCLDGAPAGFRPVVQPVPDFHYNALLAHVFEARVDAGSLVVCGYDLKGNLDSRPAARQFRRGLYRYLASRDFQPPQRLPLSWVERVLSPGGLQRLGARVLAVDSEDGRNGNVGGNAIDGNPATIWHTRWQPMNDPMPHEITVDLGKVMRLQGITCLPRQDQAGGRIAEAEIYCGAELGPEPA